MFRPPIASGVTVVLLACALSAEASMLCVNRGGDVKLRDRCRERERLLQPGELQGGEGGGSMALRNWSAPQAFDGRSFVASDGLSVATALPTSQLELVGVQPCRLYDTRGGAAITSPLGSFAAAAARDFTVTGKCGIPAEAKAVSLNLTVFGTAASGFLSAGPGGAFTNGQNPATVTSSTMNWTAGGAVLANAAVVPLDDLGRLTVYVSQATGVLFDTNGYFVDPREVCPPDSVRAGTGCMDKYEASVWRVPGATGVNAGLVAKIKNGTATASDLSFGGATQLGAASDNFAPCNDNGSACTDVFAVSLAGVTPSSRITWFQAREACKNSLKRMPSNGEWQDAVTNTPDPGPDNGTTDCKTTGSGAVSTGSRSACVSSIGAFDMVGNLWEWVADWAPASTTCPGWGGFSNDSMCLSGASTTAQGPGALLRGGYFFLGTIAGPLAVIGTGQPSDAGDFVGVRCVR